MNKTISINLGGLVFQIDENAYDLLRKYLDAIRKRFATTEGKDEIISDIEYRLAELFSEKLSSRKEVITLDDVTQATTNIGRPEDFESEDDDKATAPVETSTGTYTEEKSTKRLFRNPDDKFLGGVCGGIGAYLGIDPLWVRLIFLVTFFGFGTGFLVYIVLWIIVPKAETATEKLQMRGEKVNVQNIEKRIREEVAGVKESVSSLGKEGTRTRNFFERFGGLIAEIAKIAVRVIMAIVGVMLATLGLAFFVVLIMFVISIFGVGHNDLSQLADFIFTSATQKSLFVIGGVMLAFVATTGLTMLGFRAIVFRKIKLKAVGFALGVLAIAGFILLLISGIGLAREFSGFEKIKSNVEIVKSDADTLYLDLTPESMDEDLHQINLSFGIRHQKDYHFYSNQSEGDSHTINFENDNLYYGNVQLDIQKSKSDHFELVRETYSRGKNDMEASQLAQAVKYDVVQKDSLIQFPSYIVLSKGEKFRNQHVHLILYVPEGKTVFLGHNLKHFIYAVDNVTNTLDKDMVDHFWVMKHAGLTCPDFRSDHSDGKVQITNPRTKQLSFEKFSEVSIKGAFQVAIIQSDHHNVQLTADELDFKRINVSEEDGRLVIDAQSDLRSNAVVEIRVPDLTELLIAGENHVQLKGFDQASFTVNVSGMSTVDADLSADNFVGEISGQSELTVRGKTEDADFTLAGSSTLQADNFESNTTHLEMSGSCNAHVFSIKELTVHAAGNCAVNYRGNPELTTQIEGSSTVEKE